jgi:two-component system sensor histidine kinase ChvG
LRTGRWRSPLTRRILLMNVLVLLIPVMGLLHLDQYRNGLIEAEIVSLVTQGRAFSFALAGGAVVVTPTGKQHLVPQAARQITRLLLGDSQVRARVFLASGEMVTDSFRLGESAAQVRVIELPPPDDSGAITRFLSRLYDRLFAWLPTSGSLSLYDERKIQQASDYHEVERALAGDSSGLARRDGRGGLVLSAAVPVQRYRQVVGALMLSKDGAEIEAAVRDRRGDVLWVFAVALGVTVLLSIYLAGTIARPIRRLAEAADQVRRSRNRQAEIPDFSRRGDEIGELSEALRDMTETLWRRLDAIERFAADVAHEIKNPLTSVRSAVETVARVEDPAQQRKLMGIIMDDVQRLDRLISDISDASRLDAELSRAETESIDIAELVQALVEAQSATSDADGPRFTLDMPRDLRVTIPGYEGRLGQVFRNLLANARSFSPPGGEIRITVRSQERAVEIAVEDEGPGIPEGKLEAIFDRFYSERPKGEKFGTHSGLGLSISKQIVEAHGGSLRAENRRSEDGRIEGARFVVRLPNDEAR